MGDGPWFGDFIIGLWAERVVHADPCDCNEDEEEVGPECMKASGGKPAVLRSGGAFAEQLVVVLPSHEEIDRADGDEPPFVAVRADAWAPEERPVGEHAVVYGDGPARCTKCLTDLSWSLHAGYGPCPSRMERRWVTPWEPVPQEDAGSGDTGAASGLSGESRSGQ